jgi:iron(III) transport system substrate-binding protein
MQSISRRWLVFVATTMLVLLAACQPIQPVDPAAQSTDAPAGEAAAEGALVIYSGRSENLVAPIIEQFSEATGIEVEVRYAGTSAMAATLLEEGANSPADVFFSQDGGALGEISNAGLLAPLPAETLALVPANLVGKNGDWVGVSGRARVLVYNNAELTEADLPDDVWGLLEPEWSGRVGWAPTNASLHTFVTALRVLEGEERAEEWLTGLIANDVQAYEGNAQIVEAVAAGEISVGLVNHYYLYRFLAEQGESFSARNYHFRTPHAGTIINVAGVAILKTSQHPEAAQAFVEYLLSDEAQQYFADETFEYPLTGADIAIPDLLVPLDEIAVPDVELNDLDDLAGTLELMQSVGALE